MSRPALVLAAASVILSACATPLTSSRPVSGDKPSIPVQQHATRARMVGAWYGYQPTAEGGARQELMVRHPDGTYRLTLRVARANGHVDEQVEVGQWGVSGDVYFSIFRGWINGDELVRADAADPYNYDAYKIIALDRDKFEYTHVATGNQFACRRVAADFQMPDVRTIGMR